MPGPLRPYVQPWSDAQRKKFNRVNQAYRKETGDRAAIHPQFTRDFAVFQKILKALRIDRWCKDDIKPKVGTLPIPTMKAVSPASLNRLINRHFIHAEKRLTQHGRADWYGVDTDLCLWAGLFLKQMEQMGVPLYVHCALRTPEEQKALFHEGRSQVRGPLAAHTTGCAVDIVHSEFHWKMEDHEWAILGDIGKKVAHKLNRDMEWGGDWGWDFAHWEIKGWRQRPGVWQPNHVPIRLNPHKLTLFTP